jgi:hypothetical protein
MPNIADYVYYRLVYDYLNSEIADFGMDLMKRMMTWASAIALTLVTLWILIQGFRIATGRSRESLMEVVINMGRIVVVVAAATTMAIAGSDIHTFLTKDLDKEVHGLFTGNDNETTADSIDKYHQRGSGRARRCGNADGQGPLQLDRHVRHGKPADDGRRHAAALPVRYRSVHRPRATLHPVSHL